MKWTSVKIPSLMHDTHLCHKMLNLLIASTELKIYKYKTCYYANTCEYHIYVKYKETRHQSLGYIDTVFLGRQNHDNQINAKFEKNLVHYIEFGCL